MEKILKYLFGEKCIICNKARTKLHDDNGDLICTSCQVDLELRGDIKLKCPKCGTLMEKEYIEKTVIDKCPKCGGVFLDRGEMFGFLHEALIPRGA